MNNKIIQINPTNIIIFILIIIILYLIDVILFSSGGLLNNLQGECPIGQVMRSWDSHEKYGNINVKCGFPLICGRGEKMTTNCGPLIDNNGYHYGSCYLTCHGKFNPGILHKPIIYLYPTKEEQVSVRLNVEGKIIADYPKYNEKINGWDVIAYPDGTLIENGKEYSYLFWEAELENNNWDLSKGFIVEGKDTRDFLEEKLSHMGLTPKEYNEFIVYWYPQMMNNKYNLVYFAGEDYNSRAPLKVTPKPDSTLRIFMVVKPLKEKIKIENQKLDTFQRKGFSVIEWGGTFLND